MNNSIQLIKSKIIINVSVNICASAVPMVVLNLYILPLMSRHMNVDCYGLVLTVVSIFSVIPTTLGTALDNIRLINKSKYKSIVTYGDFNILLLIGCVIGCLLTFIGISFYNFVLFDKILIEVFELFR